MTQDNYSQSIDNVLPGNHVEDIHMPLLKVTNLKTHFPIESGLFNKSNKTVNAVDGISFNIMPGETLGLVGESGCGKTTAGRSILRLIEPTSGDITFKGQHMRQLKGNALRNMRKNMQVIFQDPYMSLNPRKMVSDIIGDALIYHKICNKKERNHRVAELLETVGLSPTYINRYPHEFSGGQRQRIGIARALALSPELIICDEAVSALDVSVQAQIINLLIKLQEERGLSYLFIAHDLSVVKHISHRIAVMYLGKIVEIANSDDLFANPLHPYTQSLLSAVPIIDPDHRSNRIHLTGDVPSPINPPSGCPFHTRCPKAIEECSHTYPTQKEARKWHMVSCLRVT